MGVSSEGLMKMERFSCGVEVEGSDSVVESILFVGIS